MVVGYGADTSPGTCNVWRRDLVTSWDVDGRGKHLLLTSWREGESGRSPSRVVCSRRWPHWPARPGSVVSGRARSSQFLDQRKTDGTQQWGQLLRSFRLLDNIRGRAWSLGGSFESRIEVWSRSPDRRCGLIASRIGILHHRRQTWRGNCLRISVGRCIVGIGSRIRLHAENAAKVCIVTMGWFRRRSACHSPWDVAWGDSGSRSNEVRT